jgi:hypothetical protein
LRVTAIKSWECELDADAAAHDAEASFRQLPGRLPPWTLVVLALPECLFLGCFATGFASALPAGDFLLCAADLDLSLDQGSRLASVLSIEPSALPSMTFVKALDHLVDW